MHRYSEQTLALEIFKTLNSHVSSPLLLKHYPHNTKDFYDRLNALETSKKANHVETLLLMIKEFCTRCHYFNQLPESNRQQLQTSIDGWVSFLQEIAENMARCNINVTCALDGFTLNRTSALIQVLQEFIIEKDRRGNPLAHKSGIASLPKNSISSYGSVNNTRPFALEENAVKNLEKSCEEIRSQIGSPEAMPKGLVIAFMMHLYEISCRHEGLSPKLLSCIQKEMKDIEKLYPSIAQAGQKLQKAIANCPLQK